MLTDQCNEAVLQATIDSAGLGGNSRFKFEVFPPTPTWSENDTDRLNEISKEISTVSTDSTFLYLWTIVILRFQKENIIVKSIKKTSSSQQLPMQ
jgi:hypothetical protein